jgi:hypothetical protein
MLCQIGEPLASIAMSQMKTTIVGTMTQAEGAGGGAVLVGGAGVGLAAVAERNQISTPSARMSQAPTIVVDQVHDAVDVTAEGGDVFWAASGACQF